MTVTIETNPNYSLGLTDYKISCDALTDSTAVYIYDAGAGEGGRLQFTPGADEVKLFTDISYIERPDPAIDTTETPAAISSDFIRLRTQTGTSTSYVYDGANLDTGTRTAVYQDEITTTHNNTLTQVIPGFAQIFRFYMDPLLTTATTTTYTCNFVTGHDIEILTTDETLTADSIDDVSVEVGVSADIEVGVRDVDNNYKFSRMFNWTITVGGDLATTQSIGGQLAGLYWVDYSDLFLFKFGLRRDGVNSVIVSASPIHGGAAITSEFDIVSA